jgi:hypothetical protein
MLGPDVQERTPPAHPLTVAAMPVTLVQALALLVDTPTVIRSS